MSNADLIGHRGAADVSFHMAPDDVLTVRVCKGGKCYTGTAPLRDALEQIRAELAMHHAAHGDAERTLADLTQATQDAVQIAGTMLAGQLLANASPRQVHTLIGFWDEIGEVFTDDIPNFLSDHKDAIKAGSAVAAGAAAAYFVDPMYAKPAAEAAGALADVSYGDNDMAKAKALDLLNQAKAQAAKDPKMAQALGIAEQSLKDTETTYTTGKIVDAANGFIAKKPSAPKSDGMKQAIGQLGGGHISQVRAQQMLANAAAHANAGNPAAQQVVKLADTMHAASVASGKPVLAAKAWSTEAKVAAGIGAAGLLALLLL